MEQILLNEQEAAKYINMSRSFLRKGRSEGAPGERTPPPPHIKISTRRIRYRKKDLDSWIAMFEPCRANLKNPE